MRVCITGGTGFIGGSLIRSLQKRGDAICVLSRRDHCNLPAGVKIVRGDLTEPTQHSLREFLRDCDVIFHCAGELRDARVMRRLHVDGTRRLLDAALNSSTASNREIHWIQLSSVGAYGPPQRASRERVVTEEFCPAPLGEYEVTKTEADALVVQAAKPGRLTYTILRPSIVFGPGMTNQSLAALMKAVEKRLFFYIGARGAVATYVHVDDVVDALIQCAVNVNARGAQYILSNDCSIEEMIESIAAALNINPPSLRVPESVIRLLIAGLDRFTKFPLSSSRVDALVKRTRYSSNKIGRELGFQPERPVPAAMAGLCLSMRSAESR